MSELNQILKEIQLDYWKVSNLIKNEANPTKRNDYGIQLLQLLGEIDTIEGAINIINERTKY